jgi:hypothetical protein
MRSNLILGFREPMRQFFNRAFLSPVSEITHSTFHCFRRTNNTRPTNPDKWILHTADIFNVFDSHSVRVPSFKVNDFVPPRHNNMIVKSPMANNG